MTIQDRFAGEDRNSSWSIWTEDGEAASLFAALIRFSPPAGGNMLDLFGAPSFDGNPDVWIVFLAG